MKAIINGLVLAFYIFGLVGCALLEGLSFKKLANRTESKLHSCID